MAVEVKVVQDPGNSFLSDLIQWDGNMPLWADKWFKGATPIKTVDDFVRVCTDKKAAEGLIDYIQINGHGNENGFRLGTEWMDVNSIEKFRSKISLVASMLSKNCAVEIQACEAGKAVEVVRKFSHFLGGVPVLGYLVETSGGGTPNHLPPVIITPGGQFSPAAPASGGFSRPSPLPPK